MRYNQDDSHYKIIKFRLKSSAGSVKIQKVKFIIRSAAVQIR